VLAGWRGSRTGRRVGGLQERGAPADAALARLVAGARKDDLLARTGPVLGRRHLDTAVFVTTVAVLRVAVVAFLVAFDLEVAADRAAGVDVGTGIRRGNVGIVVEAAVVRILVATVA